MPEDRDGVKTLFGEAVVPTPGNGGDWGGTTNGDTSFGQGGVDGGVAGEMPEVTYVDLQNTPSPNSQITTLDAIAGHQPMSDMGKK